MRDFSQFNIDLRGHTSGRIKTLCPWCSEQRRDKKDRCLSVNIDKGLYKCHHCGAAGIVPDMAEERRRQQEWERRKRQLEEQRRKGSAAGRFRRPEWRPEFLTLAPEAEDYLVRQRGISRRTLLAAKVTAQPVHLPSSPEGQDELAIGFNYFEQGQLVNTKFRTLDKRFALVPGAELIPYHIDSLFGATVCYITEGEIDALTLLHCGYEAVTSVPAGGGAKTDWMDRFVETHFEDKQTVVLCMDADEVGGKLTAELARRLGAERCRLARWEAGCKDANDVLTRYGEEAVRRCVEAAQDLPLDGIFTAGDLTDELHTLYLNGMGRGADTGWTDFDRLVSFEPGRFAVVTGRPGEGKSEWIDELCLRLCLRHEWRVAYFSPENMPIVLHLRKLAEKITGVPFAPAGRMDEALFGRVRDWLATNVSHILPADDDYTLDTLLHKAAQLVARRGIRILVCDPLNRIEQRMEAGQTELQYLSSVLNRLVRFAQQHRVLVILVAHPRKVNRNNLDGRRRRVEMNDINGSADFGNKADYCFVVDRDDERQCTHLFVDKVRFKYLGDRGEATFHYDVRSGRFLTCGFQKVYNTQLGEVKMEQKVDWRWFNTVWIDTHTLTGTDGEERPVPRASASVRPEKTTASGNAPSPGASASVRPENAPPEGRTTAGTTGERRDA